MHLPLQFSIYEYFFEKIKDKDNGSCIVTRIYFSNDEIWEKIVYINNKETDVEQKIIEQYGVYFCKKELLEESQFIKNENDKQVVIRKKSILDFKNKENINGVNNNDEKIKESKNTLGKRLGRWVGKFFIFAFETFIFGVVSGIISVLALKISFAMALCWWTPAALGIATLTALPIGWCVVLAIVAVLGVQILKEYGIKPLLKKMWNLVELKKAKKLEMEDLKEIDFHNINSRVLKNYLSSQKNIPFDEIRPSFEQNINIIKNRKLSHQTQEKFDAKSINNIPISANTWNKHFTLFQHN